MCKQRNHHLIFKVLFIGGLIAALVYFFHPGTEQFSLIINGEPVAEPLTRFAVIPTLLFTLLFLGVLMIVVFFGFSIVMFVAALMFTSLGILLVAPYFWPILVVIVLLILLMSIGEAKPKDRNS